MTPLVTLLEAKQKHKNSLVTEEFLFGGDGAPTTLLCGGLEFDFESNQVHPLFSMLPEFIHLPGNQGQLRSRLEVTLAWINEESQASIPGSETVITKLAEILFIQVIRHYVASLKEGEGGWLGGLRDTKIATALGIIHRFPQEPWTLDSLATRIGMSRTAFTSRFRQLVGNSPIAYLAQWRIFKAAELLRKSNNTIGQISINLGYQSDAAFSKRFKSLTGLSPREYRQQHSSKSISF